MNRFRLSLVFLALVGEIALADTPDDPAAAAAPAGKDVQDVIFLGAGRPVLIRLHIETDGQPFQPAFEKAWREYQDALFAYLDHDGDGFLGEKEAERAPTIEMLFPGDLGEGVHVAFNFLAIDDNRDGKVSRDELSSYYQTYGGGALKLTLYRLAFQLPIQPLDNAVFSRLDVDQDGKLSKGELTAAAAALFKGDLDDDEILTPAEIAPELFAANAQQQRGAAGGRQAPVGQRDAFAFLVLTPGDTPERWTRQLLARYGGGDANQKEGKLTRADLGLDQPTFNMLDVDKDGTLDQMELTKFVDRPGDLELHVRFGKKNGRLELVRPGTPTLPMEAQAAVKGDNFHFQLDASQFDLTVHDGAPAADIAAYFRNYYRQAVRDADENQDQKVTKDEAGRSRFLASQFDLLDRNGDGQLLEAEAIAYTDKVLALQVQAMSQRPTLIVSTEGTGVFELLDTNRDGSLGLRELRAAADALAAMDRDGDSHVARAEVARSTQVLLGRTPVSLAAQAGQGARLVRPGINGASPLAAGPIWFRKMDRNGDGDISPREFLGSKEDFAKLDVDKDSLISLEEAERAERMKPKP